MLVRLIAFLLIAETASATGLWLDGQEQIASSASVVTNSSSSVVFSNSLTAAVGGNGGAVYSNGFYVAAPFSALVWFNSTNSTYSLQHSGNNDGELGWTNTAAYDSGTYVARVTCVESRGPGTIGSMSLRIISEAGAVLNSASSTNNPLGQTITCGYTGANIKGVSIIRSGGLGQTSTLDFNNLYFSADVTSITTNSGSGTSGPTFDGIISLSTNRHTWTDGRRSP